MGYRMSWLAVRGIDKEAVYDRVRVRPTGEIGLPLDHPIAGRLLPSGWTIVVFDELAHRLVGDDELKRLSAGCTIMACNLCETTMCSSAAYWQNSKEIWCVSHFSNDTVWHLEPTGALPIEFRNIEKQYRALQAADAEQDHTVDYMIEIPLALAANVTSFRHDQGPDDFEYLELTPR